MALSFIPAAAQIRNERLSWLALTSRTARRCALSSRRTRPRLEPKKRGRHPNSLLPPVAGGVERRLLDFRHSRSATIQAKNQLERPHDHRPQNFYPDKRATCCCSGSHYDSPIGNSRHVVLRVDWRQAE